MADHQDIDHVQPQQEGGKNSAVNESGTPQLTGNAICYWNGAQYSPGGRVCDNRRLYICSANGTWYFAGTC